MNTSLTLSAGGSSNSNFITLFTDVTQSHYHTLHWVTFANSGQSMSVSISSYNKVAGSVVFYIESWAKPHLEIIRLGGYL